VEAITKSKKDVQAFIEKELTSILITVNPKLDKKDFKKSIKKAGKALYRGSKKKGKNSKEVISNPAMPEKLPAKKKKHSGE
jgi:hypothetical protein